MEKSNCEIGYDHKRKTERLIINNIIVLLLSFCITVLFPVWLVRLVGLLCGGWIMGDLNKPLLFRVDARKRGKGRAQEKQPGHARHVKNLLNKYVL